MSNTDNRRKDLRNMSEGKYIFLNIIDRALFFWIKYVINIGLKERKRRQMSDSFRLEINRYFDYLICHFPYRKKKLNR